MQLRPDQAKVAAYQGGMLAVPAVPGAGKTMVLAFLAARVIAERQAPPGRVLIVTCMNTAVANYRRRLAELLEQQGLSPSAGYEVKTLHSLALAILREQAFLQELGDDNLRVLDDTEQELLVGQVTDHWRLAHRAEWEEVVRPAQGSQRERWLELWRPRTVQLMRSLIASFKIQRLQPAEVELRAVQVGSPSILPWAAAIYAAYQQALARRGQMDYEDLLAGALQLLEAHPEICRRWQQRWSHVFEDEAQDSNFLQAQLLNLLVGGHGNLVRVGDSNQAIMGTFTAADPGVFRGFCQQPGVKVEPLRYSGRNTRDIIELANYLVEWTSKKHPMAACRTALEDQVILPVPPGEHPPNPVPGGYTTAVRSYQTSLVEALQIARHAARVAIDNPAGTVAVLAPDRFLLQEVALQLRQQGVEFRELHRLQQQRQQPVRQLGTILEYLFNPCDSEALTRVVGVLEPENQAGNPEQDFGAWLQTLELEEWLYPLAVADGVTGPDNRPPSATSLARLRRWLDWAATMPASALILMLAADLGMEAEELAIAQRLVLEVEYLLGRYPGIEEAELLSTVFSGRGAVAQFCNWVYDFQGLLPQPGIIDLVTCHKAKGLEWDTVFAMGLTAENFPSRPGDRFRDELAYLQDWLVNPLAVTLAQLQSSGAVAARELAQQEIVSERLRLLYVTITRARVNLLLSYHGQAVSMTGNLRRVRAAEPVIALQQLVEERTRNGKPAIT